MNSNRQVSLTAVLAVVYAASISAIYFALGVIAHHANGLTPEVFLAAAIFFQLTAMTYAEGTSLHSERGGSAVFGRYAFNELVSFTAGWALVLDYVILVAVAALSVPAYLSILWPALGQGAGRIIAGLLVIGLVSVDNLRGISALRLRWRVLAAAGDVVVVILVIVLGLALAFHGSHLSQAVHLGRTPTVAGLAFAFPIAVIAFTGLEAASSLAGEVSATGRDVRRLVGIGSAAIALLFVGIAIVGVGVLPVHHGLTELGRRNIRAPLLGIVEAYHPRWVADILKYVVGIGGAVALTAAAGAALLGVSRLGYSLATNRQIPSAVGRLSRRWSTPWVVIGAAAVIAAVLSVVANLDYLVGIYAFGALLAFSIAHVSVIAMRFREPGRARGYRVPLSVRVGGGSLPLPTVAGAILSVVGLVLLLIFHAGARYVGVGWLVAGLALYVTYRKTQSKPLLRRISIPERALRHEDVEPEFGSILVPVFGTPLDDDVVQTAARLAGATGDELSETPTIEAIWVLEMPMAVPLEAPLPDSRTDLARAALKRAREVGEEYEGVTVATAMVRARRAGQAIVNEARRRGVEVIVLAADEPSGIRGGGLLGGRPLDNYVGEVTKYVVSKAPCRVIITAPPTDWRERFERRRQSVAPTGSS